MSKIIVVGGGLAGSLIAIYLAKGGHIVHVFEKRGDPQQNLDTYVDQISSRAIGVSMTVRGIKSVLAAGIPKHELDLCGLPITGMSFYVAGKLKIRKLVPNEGLYPLSLNRAAFQCLLNKHAHKNQVNYHFHHKCLNVDIDKKTILTQSADGQVHTTTGDFIIGADGARSQVRQAMQNQVRRFEFQQSFFRHGYKTLVLPDAEAINFRKDLLYFFGMDSKGLFAGRAATIPDGSVSFAICLPYQGSISLDTRDKHTMEQFFTRYLPPLPVDSKMQLVEQFINKPSNDLINVRSSTFHYKANTVLIGDSAHATAPFLGQGMNMALEDTHIFSNLLKEHNNNTGNTLQTFTNLRKKEADAMQDMARANYNVLSCSNPIFFMRAQYTRFMNQRFPGIYPPDMAQKLYFTTMAYKELFTMQKKQNRWYKLGRMN